MLPPMNPYSIATMTVGMPSSRPDATTTASFRPVDLMLAASRAAYGLVSMNFSGSHEVSSLSYSSHVAPSNSISSRSAAVRRKWCAQWGHTCRCVQSSLL